MAPPYGDRLRCLALVTLLAVPPCITVERDPDGSVLPGGTQAGTQGAEDHTCIDLPIALLGIEDAADYCCHSVHRSGGLTYLECVAPNGSTVFMGPFSR